MFLSFNLKFKLIVDNEKKFNLKKSFWQDWTEQHIRISSATHIASARYRRTIYNLTFFLAMSKQIAVQM